MKNKGFTLMELLAVLVILAIISLITVPIVVGIIASSKEQSYKNSIVSYGKAVANAIETKRVETGSVATSIKELEGYLTTSGNDVICNDNIKVSDDGIVLRFCKVVDNKGQQKSKYAYKYNNGQITKEEGENDLTQLEEADEALETYKSAVEYAIAFYQLSNSDGPQTLDQITEEIKIKTGYPESKYSIECDNDIEQINENILRIHNCKVFSKYGRTLDFFKYIDLNLDDARKYTMSKKVTLNSEDYYIVSDNGEDSDYVTLIKAEPLTVEEVKKYGEGHINRYTRDNRGMVYNYKGYGGIAYYTSATCGYPTAGGPYVGSGCESEHASSYDQSDVKYVVDAWANDKFKNNELATDKGGYQARLLTYHIFVKDYYSNWCGRWETYSTCVKLTDTLLWLTSNEYEYYMMDPVPYNPVRNIWTMANPGINFIGIASYNAAIRPVINVYKSLIN